MNRTKATSVIVMSCLILVSGMNLHIMSHYCMNKHVASSFSFGETITDCCNNATPASQTELYYESAGCCKNFDNPLKVDKYYQGCDFNQQFPQTHVLEFIHIPEFITLEKPYRNTHNLSYYQSGWLYHSDVSLSEISVYLI